MVANRNALALIGTGGLAPLDFTIESGELPNGLSLDAQRGLIAGTTTAPSGDYEITLRVKTARETNRSVVTIRVIAAE